MTITDETLKKVAEKSMQNAASLRDDADILKEAKRYQRAYALYQFSMEEVGKAIESVLLLVLIDPQPEDIRQYKKNFFKHTAKIKRSSALDTFICQVLYKGDYDGALLFLKSSFAEDENELDDCKNKSLYTSVIGDHVKTPLEMIDEEKMNYIWLRAITRYKIAEPFVRMLIEHYETLREYQKENGSLKHMSRDSDEVAKEFWDEITGKE